MNRKCSLCLLLIFSGLAVRSAQPQDQADADLPVDIAALQQDRIRLLEERVSFLKSAFGDRTVSRTELIPAEMDLLTARLEYAPSDTEKKQLLADLLKKYDALIDITESALNAPARVGGAEQHKRHMRDEVSKMYFLKAERVRIQIQLASLV